MEYQVLVGVVVGAGIGVRVAVAIGVEARIGVEAVNRDICCSSYRTSILAV
jgi:hypothetical protein